MSPGPAEVPLDLAGGPTGGTGTGSPAGQPAPQPPVRATGFLRDLADQLRAGDAYGRFDRFPDEHLLRPLVVPAAQRLRIPVNCDVEPATQGRLRSFYQAVAVGIEKQSGVMTGAVVDLSHEGFGRALVFAGRLIVVSDVLRDAQRFGFPDLDALARRGDRLVEAGIALVRRHPEVARAED
ncbi:MAG TPA: NifX-associated nitrogen fixation protein [Kineosporiaceae bacterium]|nr:NifX-associated nitrogen fixation protein [Kineosporiaceae bacterium]